MKLQKVKKHGGKNSFQRMFGKGKHFFRHFTITVRSDTMKSPDRK